MIESAVPAVEPPYLPGMEPDRSQQQYTYRDVAALKKVSVQTVMEWVKRGKCPSPIYTGATARFTHAHVADILAGISPAGTHQVAESVRAEVGAKGGKVVKKLAAAKKRAAAKKLAPRTIKDKKRKVKKLVAGTPAAKKIAARRKGGA